MNTTDLMEALADCLCDRELTSALDTLSGAGRTATAWAGAIAGSLRSGLTVAMAFERNVRLRAAESRLLRAAEGSPAALAGALRCIVVRRRVRRERIRAAIAAVAAPLALIALTLAIDPLPALVLGGAYLGPVLRALAILVLSLALALAGVWIAFVHPRTAPALWSSLARLPGVGSLARRHSEAELSLVFAVLSAPDRVPTRAFEAAVAVVEWAPFAPALHRAAARSRDVDESMGPKMSEFAPHLSEAFHLVLVAGGAAARLPERLMQFSEDNARTITRRLAFTVRTLAFAALLVLSMKSLASLIGRTGGGLPNIPGLPGLPGELPTTPEQKELEQIMKEGH